MMSRGGVRRSVVLLLEDVVLGKARHARLRVAPLARVEALLRLAPLL